MDLGETDGKQLGEQSVSAPVATPAAIPRTEEAQTPSGFFVTPCHD